LFGESLDHGLSIVARKLCNDKGIVGVSINERSCKSDGEKMCKLTEEIQDCNLKKMFEALTFITREPKLHEKLCQEEIFHVGMLSVAESHYGRGIGQDLVKKSLELARDKNFQFAKTAATNDNTRKIAEKLGMQKFWSATFKDILCRGNIKTRALPECPHTGVNIYILDLKTLPPKCK
jgi:GNAT superfamily N-acetyltransferase